jgi:hypothetical protein
MKIKSIIFIVLGVMMICLILIGSCSHTPVINYTPVAQNHTSIRPVVNVYIENTGSMAGYMCSGSEYKDAIYSYLSELDASCADTLKLNYINTQVIPYKGGLVNFIKGLTPTNILHTGGNTNFSDIGDMLQTIICKTHDNVISIFVSDCILALPNGATQDYYVNRQIEIKNTISKYLNNYGNLGIEIFRLESKFIGNYYPGSIYLNGKRPYYMFVFGDKKILSEMNKKVPFTAIKHGVKNYYAYTTESQIPFQITNKFGVSNPKGLPLKTKGKSGDYEFMANMDLSQTLQGDEVLEQVSNYEIDNASCKVVSITNTGGGDYTHIITLSLNKNIKAAANTVSLHQPALPTWLDYANADANSSIKSNMDKTIGVKYIIGGISDAYNGHLMHFDFEISNK